MIKNLGSLNFTILFRINWEIPYKYNYKVEEKILLL